MIYRYSIITIISYILPLSSSAGAVSRQLFLLFLTEVKLARRCMLLSTLLDLTGLLFNNIHLVGLHNLGTYVAYPFFRFRTHICEIICDTSLSWCNARLSYVFISMSKHLPTLHLVDSFETLPADKEGVQFPSFFFVHDEVHLIHTFRNVEGLFGRESNLLLMKNISGLTFKTFVISSLLNFVIYLLYIPTFLGDVYRRASYAAVIIDLFVFCTLTCIIVCR